MGYSTFDPAGQNQPAWNAGRKVGAKRALKQKEVWAIRDKIAASKAKGMWMTLLSA